MIFRFNHTTTYQIEKIPFLCIVPKPRIRDKGVTYRDRLNVSNILIPNKGRGMTQLSLQKLFVMEILKTFHKSMKPNPPYVFSLHKDFQLNQ